MKLIKNISGRIRVTPMISSYISEYFIDFGVLHSDSSYSLLFLTTTVFLLHISGYFFQCVRYFWPLLTPRLCLCSTHDPTAFFRLSRRACFIQHLYQLLSFFGNVHVHHAIRRFRALSFSTSLRALHHR